MAIQPYQASITSVFTSSNLSGLPVIVIIVLVILAIVTSTAIFAGEKKPIKASVITASEDGFQVDNVVDVTRMENEGEQVPEKGFVGIEAFKRKQKEHLLILQKFAEDNEWEHINTHSSHPNSGFDWWMVPINRKSAGYGKEYQVSEEDAAILVQDPEFLSNYRKGIILIAASWGWNLETREYFANEKQTWSGYQVRLGKMLDSLILFGQKDLHSTLVYFIKHEIVNKEAPIEKQKTLNMCLEPWILKYLTYLETRN